MKPPIDLYIEKNETLVPCDDPDAFAKWFDTGRRQILSQVVTPNVTVTAICLGVPSAPGLKDVYEARVFGGLGTGTARRASSRQELAGVFEDLVKETRRGEGLEAVDEMRSERAGSKWDW